MPHGFDITDDHSKCDTEKKVREYWMQHGRIIVWSGESENTMYANPETNHAFRAWHDWVHVTMNLGHNTEHESLVCRQQQEMVLFHAHKYVVGHDRWTLVKLLECEIIEQRKYYDRYGHYVPNQREFTKEYMGWK